MNVTNNTANPFVLPFDGALPIEPGATAPVDAKNWDAVKDHPLIASLLDQKLLTTGGKVQDAPVVDSPDESPAAQLEAMTRAQQAGEPELEAPRRGRARKADADTSEE